MVATILCAAGSGARTGLKKNKIFAEVDGLPAITHCLSAFAPFSEQIIIACRKEDEARIRPLLSPFPMASTVVGGATRSESVFRALEGVTADMVLIHDAARPFVSPALIEDCIANVQAYGSAVCALPFTDTAVLLEGDVPTPLPRSKVYTVQTPQGFLTEELRGAYKRAEAEGRLGEFTDDGGVFAAYVRPPHLFLGDARNRKLTYPSDFPAERVGFGVDTHAFAHQNEIDSGIARLNLNYIKLCGVTVPSDRAIEAHSDGDVPVHALMDALLSAIGESDIGHLFPDTDPAYANADSMKLLAVVMERVRAKGYGVKNASIAIVCERPRLSPHIEHMRERVTEALQAECVGISAGTNERLGYVGEGRGITAYATVLLKSSC